MAAANPITSLFSRKVPKSTTADPIAADVQRRLDDAQARCARDIEEAQRQADEARRAADDLALRADAIRGQVERLKLRADEQASSAASDAEQLEQRRRTAAQAFAAAVAAGDAAAEASSTQALQAAENEAQQPSAAQRQLTALRAEIEARTLDLQALDMQIAHQRRQATAAEARAAQAEWDSGLNAFAAVAIRVFAAMQGHNMPATMQKGEAVFFETSRFMFADAPDCLDWTGANHTYPRISAASMRSLRQRLYGEQA